MSPTIIALILIIFNFLHSQKIITLEPNSPPPPPKITVVKGKFYLKIILFRK